MGEGNEMDPISDGILSHTLNEIGLIETQMDILTKQMKSYRQKIAEKTKYLQEICPHTNLIRESDHDYHRPTYYYVCKVCKSTFSKHPKN